MNGVDVLRVQAACDELWPHSERQVDDDRLALRVKLWQEILAGITAPEAEAAIASLAAEGEKFAPVIRVIRKRALALRQQITGSGGVPSGADAWAEVLQLIQRRGHIRPPEAEHCSHPAIFKAVETFGWMNLCLSENQMADRAHFIKFYEDISSRFRDHMAGPARSLGGPALGAGDGRVLDSGSPTSEDEAPYARRSSE